MNNFLSQLTNSYTLSPCGDGFILSTPIMYPGADHTFSFYIEENGHGFKINDQGQTLDFLRENFNPKRYENRINAICEAFEITFENGIFYGELASYESHQTMRNLHKFMGAMYMIAHVDILN